MKITQCFYGDTPDHAYQNCGKSSDEILKEEMLYYSENRKSRCSKVTNNKPKMNPTDQFGNVKACTYCKCLYHSMDCPYAPHALKRNFKGKDRRYKGYFKPLRFDDNECNIIHYTDCDTNNLGETLGQAIVDTGCPCTVAGEDWFKIYVNTLSIKDRFSIKTSN